MEEKVVHIVRAKDTIMSEIAREVKKQRAKEQRVKAAAIKKQQDADVDHNPLSKGPLESSDSLKKIAAKKMRASRR